MQIIKIELSHIQFFVELDSMVPPWLVRPSRYTLTRPRCGCDDGPSTWTRVAFLNMSDPTHMCPINWTTITT